MTGEDSQRRPPRTAAALGSLAGLAEMRVRNAVGRMAASGVAAVLLALIIGHWAPFAWLAFILPALELERRFAKQMKRRFEADAQTGIGAYVAWTFAQSAANNTFAVIAWFMEPRHGDAIAALFLAGGALNALVTLRASWPLMLAGLSATVLTMIALPVSEILFSERNVSVIEFGPLFAVAVFSSFAYYVWLSLREADAAHVRAEASAQRAQRLSRDAANARADFVALMKHEVRTPMTALSGSAEVLRRVALPPEARAEVDALLEASDVLSAVLDDLVDLDAIESGRLALQTRRVDPGALVRSVAQAFRTQAEDKGLELFVDVADNAPKAVLLDPVRVRQILFNLTSNAVKYTLSGGVRLRLQAAASERAGYVRLGVSVADTGVGMSRAELASYLTERRAGGARKGLGLVICAKLARIMGAKLGAKSTPGQGSMFSLVIEAEVADAQPARPAKARYLIVQHEAETRRALGAILDTSGASYDIAEDGARGLEMLHGARYDLVIADHDAPQFDAIDIAEMLTQGGPSAAAPVIALVNDAGAAQLCAESGVAGAVMKPLSPPALLDEIARVRGAAVRAA